MPREVRIDEISLGDRHRKDLGDIRSLADSIDSIGLIHPPVVTPDNRLVAGERRLAAVRSLGWETVPVTVVHTLNGLPDLLQAECDENTCRKDFAPTEAASIRRAVAEALAPIAAENKATAIRERDDKGRAKSTGGKLPPVARPPKTRDIAAKGTGYSGRTLDKVDAVVAVAESEAFPEPVKEVAREAIQEMDVTGNVSKAHQKVTEAQQVHDAVSEFPDLAHYADSSRGADAIRLANALRGYTEPEFPAAIDALRRTIAAEKAGKLTPKSPEGPDYRALADKMFFAANAAAQAIERSGGAATIDHAVALADQLAIVNWRRQFESLADKCQALAQACTPRLKVIQ